MAWMYSPRGVFLGGTHLVVADSGNHRVLIWHGMPAATSSPPTWCSASRTATTEGRAAGGRGPERGMNLPTGVLVHDGRLIVADAWHHRILVWNSVPETSDVAPDLVLGQPDASSVSENRGGRVLGVDVLLAVRDRGGRIHLLGRRHRQPPGSGLAQRHSRARPAGRHRARAARRRRARGEPRRRRPAPEASAGRTTSPGATTCCSSPTPVTTACWAGRRRRTPTATPTWCWVNRTSPAPTNGRTVRTPATGSGSRTRRACDGDDGWRSPTPPTTASCCGTACPSTVAAPITFWRNMISAPTARTAGPRCSGTPCAGRTGCRCAVTRWRWPTPATTA